MKQDTHHFTLLKPATSITIEIETSSQSLSMKACWFTGVKWNAWKKLKNLSPKLLIAIIFTALFAGLQPD